MEDRAGRRIGEVVADYEGWLEKQPLSENTKRAYRTRAGQFLSWLGVTPAEYGDALSEEHARDYAVSREERQRPGDGRGDSGAQAPGNPASSR